MCPLFLALSSLRHRPSHLPTFPDVINKWAYSGSILVTFHFTLVVPVEPPELELEGNPIIEGKEDIEKKRPDREVAIRFGVLIPVGIAVVDVAGVK